MRKDGKPHLLEAMTYRYKGHSVSDPATYRSKEEVERYKQIDPITQLGNKLIEEKILNEEELKQIDKKVRAQVKEIEKAADEAPLPEISSAYEHVFID